MARELACSSPRVTEMPSVRSKDQFQCELDFPVGGGGLINRARAANRRSVLAKERAVIDGRCKVGMIEYIEKLCAEFQLQVLLDLAILDEKKIDIYQAGAVDLVPTPVAEPVRAGSRQHRIPWAAGLERHALRCDGWRGHWKGEALYFYVIAHVSGIDQRPAARAPESLRIGKRSGVEQAQRIAADQRSKRQPAPDLKNAPQLPPASRPRCGAVERVWSRDIPDIINH